MCNHDHVEVLQTHPETGEVYYRCLDCGAVVDQDGEIVKTDDQIKEF